VEPARIALPHAGERGIDGHRERVLVDGGDGATARHGARPPCLGDEGPIETAAGEVGGELGDAGHCARIVVQTADGTLLERRRGRRLHRRPRDPIPVYASPARYHGTMNPGRACSLVISSRPGRQTPRAIQAIVSRVVAEACAGPSCATLESTIARTSGRRDRRSGPGLWLPVQ